VGECFVTKWGNILHCKLYFTKGRRHIRLKLHLIPLIYCMYTFVFRFTSSIYSSARKQAYGVVLYMVVDTDCSYYVHSH